MAWTAPLTAVDGREFTAQQYNIYIRDNFLELAPQKVTEAGQYLVSEDFNKIAARKMVQSTVSSSQTRTSTNYGDLSTNGPDVTVTHGAQILVFLSAKMSNSVANNQCAMSFASHSGAASVSASDKWKIKTDGVPIDQEGRYSAMRLVGDLDPGKTTFRAKYRVGGGTGTFSDRTMAIVPL